MGWDIEDEFNAETSGWAAKVHSTIPRIEEDEMVLLRRIEKKLEIPDGEEGIDVLDPKDSRRGKVGEGTGGNEVATEAEERGFVGPSEWERSQV